MGGQDGVCLRFLMCAASICRAHWLRQGSIQVGEPGGPPASAPLSLGLEAAQTSEHTLSCLSSPKPPGQEPSSCASSERFYDFLRVTRDQALGAQPGDSSECVLALRHPAGDQKKVVSGRWAPGTEQSHWPCHVVDEQEMAWQMVAK